MNENNDLLNSALSLAISKTIENMTFVEVDDEMEEIDDVHNIEEMCWAILPIIKPVEGKIALEVPNECAILFIKNVYGEAQEEDISDNEIKDILSEILNTIGGRFMNSLLPSDQEFELGLPISGRGALPEQEMILSSKSTSVGHSIVTVYVIGEDFNKLNI